MNKVPNQQYPQPVILPDNLKVYTDDEIIISMLKSWPPMPETNNQQVLRYIDQAGAGRNLMLLYHKGAAKGAEDEDEINVLLKFDKRAGPEDAGLVLLQCPAAKTYSMAMYLAHYWDAAKAKGGDPAFSERNMQTMILVLSTIARRNGYDPQKESRA